MYSIVICRSSVPMADAETLWFAGSLGLGRVGSHLLVVSGQSPLQGVDPALLLDKLPAQTADCELFAFSCDVFLLAAAQIAAPAAKAMMRAAAMPTPAVHLLLFALPATGAALLAKVASGSLPATLNYRRGQPRSGDDLRSSGCGSFRKSPRSLVPALIVVGLLKRSPL